MAIVQDEVDRLIRAAESGLLGAQPSESDENAEHSLPSGVDEALAALKRELSLVATPDGATYTIPSPRV